MVQSPVGEAASSVSIDSESLLQMHDAWQQALLASAASTRRIVSGPETPLRLVGQELFAVLFGDPAIAGRYRSSLAIAQERNEPLRVVLRLYAPELAPLPWEAMYDAESAGYVSRTEPLVRHVPVASAPLPLRVTQPLRILAITASPRGLPALDIEKEEEQLREALADPIRRGAINLHWARNATWDTIQNLLLTQEFHVVHFIGHGDFDIGEDEGVLALVGNDGRVNRVEASRFADLLREASPMPRLVVLNSCLTAASGATDLFSGTAAALVHGGVSAVAAMQFEITDSAAVAFARGFYSAIAAGRPVDQAVRSGRVAILGTNGHTLEWITPVLYLRAAEAQVFSIQAPHRTHDDLIPDEASDDSNRKPPQEQGREHALPAAKPRPDHEPAESPDAETPAWGLHRGPRGRKSGTTRAGPSPLAARGKGLPLVSRLGENRTGHPKEITFAFWLFIGAALLMLPSLIFSITGIPHYGNPRYGDLTESETESIVRRTALMLIFAGMVWMALCVMAAFMIRQGRRWARTTSTLLIVVSVVWLDVDLVYLAVILLNAVGVAMLYTRPASAFFAGKNGVRPRS